MSFTFDLTSSDAQAKQIARVRNTTDDTGDGSGGGVEGTDYFLSDERIALFLADVAADPITATSDVNIAKLASAAALQTLSKNQAFVLKVGATMGESFDGAKVAAEIRANADSLREQVKASEKLKLESQLPSGARRIASVGLPTGFSF